MEVFIQRKMRSRLDLLHPSLLGKVHKTNSETHDRKGHERKCTRRGSVYVKSFGPGIIDVAGPVSYAVALQDGRECRKHVDHLRSRRADSDSIILVCQREQMDTNTEITPQNAYKPFGSVLSTRETEVVASIPDAPITSVTPEATEVAGDNVVTDTRDSAVFTPTPELPRVITPAKKTGRSRVAPAWQADYVMD